MTSAQDTTPTVNLSESDINVTSSEFLNTTITVEASTREVFTGRWAVFNDPNLHPSLIPDSLEEREGLRVVLLVSSWTTITYGGYTAPMMKINHEKLMRYYYTEHQEKNGYITLCAGLVAGPHRSFFCYNQTKQAIDKYAKYQTFDFVWENSKEAFLSDMIILPVIFVIGSIGKSAESLFN